MTDAMEYKGYVGSVHYSDEDETFHGKLRGIRDLVSYEGTNVANLKRSFHEAVDDYLETCRRLKKNPEIPFKGTFNVRVAPELHRRAAHLAADRGTTLNVLVSKAVEQYVEVERSRPPAKRR